MRSMNVTDLATERRRRCRPAAPCSAYVSRTDREPSIEIERRDLPALASPPAMAQLAMLLDDDAIELRFVPRATLIERLRFAYGVDEFVDMMRVTLDRRGAL